MDINYEYYKVFLLCGKIQKYHQGGAGAWREPAECDAGDQAFGGGTGMPAIVRSNKGVR